MKKLLALLVFAGFMAAPIAVLAIPEPTYAAQTAADKACERRILTFPTWFRGLSVVDGSGNCTVMSPAATTGGLSGFIWRIVLNIIEIALQLVGYIAAFFIIYGGFQFLTGGSNPGQIEKARATILNAVIGLAISMASIGLVNLVFGIIG